MINRLWLVAVLAVLPVAAHAQSRTQQAVALFQAETAIAPLKPLKISAPGAAAGDLSDPALFRVSRADEPASVRPKGTVQTALDHAFSPSRTVVGSLGYLCGLQPGSNLDGGVASSYEPAGTFLGGQLHIAF